MIIVIADDFTGAAEIGGLALRFGLTVEIHTKWPVQSNADLLVFDTGTRSKSLDEAKMISLDLISYIKSLSPEWIFKKIDSVLRGHILEETNVILNSLEVKNAILIPANPKLGRIISDGIYYIDEVPIMETSFANDPEFTIKTSYVNEIIAQHKSPVNLHYITVDSQDNSEGIQVGEVRNEADIDTWALQRLQDTFHVGSAGYFEAILRSRGYSEMVGSIHKIEERGVKRLIICGSAYQESRDFVQNALRSGFPVSSMSDAIFENPSIDENQLEQWKNDVMSKLRIDNMAMVAIAQPVKHNNGTAVLLKRKISRLIQMVFDECDIDEFLIEGGATASEIMEQLKISSVVPVHQYNQGVIRLKIENNSSVSIVLKPGSYKWPEEVLTIN